MAVEKKQLTVTEFDFDEVKDNLKVFMRNQTEFKDYDFEGSGLNALLDVLAYNTHYLGFNANMLANEMFLDSAQVRSSVVSHAKTLGYTTRSSRAPKATVHVYLNTENTNATIPSGTVFNTTVGGAGTITDASYQFVTVEDVTVSNIGNVVPFMNIPIYEGSYVSSRYTVDNQNVEQRFLIHDDRVDTTTLTVKVQNSSTDTTQTAFTLATDIAALTSTSNVYFVQEVEDGKFEIYFGDGILGNDVSDGNIIVLNYVVTNRSEANGASIFTNAAAIDTVNSINVVTVSNAAGGSGPETIQSIKYNAPLDYASQGRCVTTEDYKTYVKQLFANTQAVSVWGGENGSYNPVTGVSETAEYGKVFISVKSTTGLNLNEIQKAQLVTDLSPYTVASITPVVVNPEILYLIPTVNFKYDSNATNDSKETLQSLINDEVASFNANNLKVFNTVFRHSSFVARIDDVSDAILNNTSTISLGLFHTPNTNGSYAFTLNFSNPFYNPHSGHNASSGGVIASTGFYISGNTNEMFFDDDGAGALRIYYLVSGVRTYYNETAGIVDYENGTITVDPVYITTVSNVDEAASSAIRVTVTPASYDVIGKRNQILEIDTLNTSITGAQDTVVVGSSGGTGYVTNSNYVTPSSY